jgi:hypothetical protein
MLLEFHRDVLRAVKTMHFEYARGCTGKGYSTTVTLSHDDLNEKVE